MKTELINVKKLETAKVRLLAAYSYEPKILKNFINNRRFSALVYVLKGTYLYRFRGEEIVLNADHCIYLPPYGEEYSYEIVSGETETIQVDFEILGTDGGQIPLSKVPKKIKSDGGRIKSFLQSLVHIAGGDTVSARLEIRGKMDLILSAMLQEEENKGTSKAQQKIAPALEWLGKNYREPFSTKDLARRCNLSQSQLRRLFKSVTGKSPLAWRNEQRLEKAAGMLISGDLNVSEVAFATGFEDIYAFSHAFKKQKGISPSLYQGEME